MEALRQELSAAIQEADLLIEELRTHRVLARAEEIAFDDASEAVGLLLEAIDGTV